MKIRKLLCFAMALVITILSAITTNAAQISKVTEKYNSTAAYINTLYTQSTSFFDSEWAVIGLSRANKISNEFTEAYYNHAVNYVKENGSAKLSKNTSTENSKMIIALSALKKGATDIAGYNLLTPLADFNFVKKQGINGPIWALIAFDTYNYEIPVDKSVEVQTTRRNLIDYILDKQLEDGGWALSGKNSDPDITSMALQALSRYCYYDDVNAACQTALNTLSSLQRDDGGFASFGVVNSGSCAQTLVALTSLNINPLTDKRFIKNGKTVIDAIMSFSKDNGFAHTADGNYNQMATEQCFYALTSYFRFINSQTSLYNMSDIAPSINFSDVNGDGNFDISDATYIQKFISKSIDISDEHLYNADVNHDGDINISDATLVQKSLAGIK